MVNKLTINLPKYKLLFFKEEIHKFSMLQRRLKSKKNGQEHPALLKLSDEVRGPSSLKSATDLNIVSLERYVC